MSETVNASVSRGHIPFVDLVGQNAHYGEEWMRAVSSVIESGRFVGGEEVTAFEREFASFCGCRYGIGTASGSDALRLALLALGVGRGDEVITVSHTFVSTADAIVHAGATPVFVDVDPETYTMDTSQLDALLGPEVKAVIPVHLYGQSADMAPILELCEDRAVPVVEDAAQAHGASYDSRPCGSMGQLACFSFYPSKNLGAFGDGGFITTNDMEVADRLRLLREYGQSKKYHHKLVGFNSRLDAIQAAVLRRKLVHLNDWNQARRRLARQYDDRLQEVKTVLTPYEAEGRRHVYHIYTIRTRHRDRLREWLSRNGIETGIHYPVPVHLQGAYAKVPYRALSLDRTTSACREILSLPMYPELTEEEVDTVCDTVAGEARLG